MKTEVLSSTLANVLLHVARVEDSTSSQHRQRWQHCCTHSASLPYAEESISGMVFSAQFPSKKKQKRTRTCVNSTTILIISTFEAICPLFVHKSCKILNNTSRLICTFCSNF
uniref:(northern house mosquito) hypothetical protein n=1 Tax=Culex pipiens TaxID=7175 RepID=A0A8D8L4D0_CULPI